MSIKDLNPAWTPPLGSDVLYEEYTWFTGTFILGIGYGITVPLALQCEAFLYKSIDRTNLKTKLAWMAVIFVLFVCATIAAVTGEQLTQLSFINYRNYPGGPSAFEVDFNSLPVNGVGNVFLVIADWVCTGIQLWRFYVLYSNSRFPIWMIMLIPFLAYVATIALGIIWSVQITQPTSSEFVASTANINWTSPYLGLSLALNIALSAALVLRLLMFRWKFRQSGLSSIGNSSVNYLGVVSMIVESAIIYSTSALLALVFFSANLAIQNIFSQLFIEAEIAATLLILYRVVSGSAWSTNTTKQLASIQTASLDNGGRVELGKLPTYDNSSRKFSTLGDSNTLASTADVPLGDGDGNIVQSI